MRTRLILSVFLVTAVLGLTGCGYGSGAGSDDPEPTGDSSRTLDVPNPDARGEVTSVVAVRAGGLKGDRERWVFRPAAAPPAGRSTADVRAVLEAASDPALTLLILPEPEQTCCDLYAYGVTITYDAGDPVRFSTVTGARWPEPFQTLMDALI